MSISGKILDRFTDKTRLAGSTGRSDLFVADVEPINETQCRLLIGYAQELSSPTAKNVEEFVNGAYQNKLVAQTGSITEHLDDNAVSLVVSINRPTRSLADASGMTRISSNMYIDQSTKNMWQVVDNGSLKFLIRQTDENIAEIIEARKSQRSSRKEARFETLKTAAPLMGVGDHVKFLAATGAVLMGEITSMSGQKCTIKASGGSHTVDKGAVFGVVERSKKNIADEMRSAEEYFSKMFGDPAFAKKLVRK